MLVEATGSLELLAAITVSFAIIAAVYSIAGFGGGSSYLAMLVLAGLPYALVPRIALACNITVVSVSCYVAWRQDLLWWRAIWPYVACSVPMAFLGGSIPITRDLFLILLGLSLCAAGSRLLWSRSAESQAGLEDQGPGVPIAGARLFGIVTGAAIGFTSGLVGIGGGIFLSPVLHLTGRLPARQINAIASLFILVNSVAGLFGQLSKQTGDFAMVSPLWTLTLCAAVFVGGQVGSRLGLRVFPAPVLRRVTAALVLFAGLRVTLGGFGFL